MNHTKYTIYFILTLLIWFAAGVGVGYHYGAKDMADQVKEQMK